MPVEEAICINPESFPIKILHFLICAATSIKFNLPQKFLILFFFKCLIIFFVFFLSFEEPKKTIDFFFQNFFSFKIILINLTNFFDGQTFAGQFAEAPIAIGLLSFKKSLEIFLVSFFKIGI